MIVRSEKNLSTLSGIGKREIKGIDNPIGITILAITTMTITLPELRENDVLVKVKACGVCGTVSDTIITYTNSIYLTMAFRIFISMMGNSLRR